MGAPVTVKVGNVVTPGRIVLLAVLAVAALLVVNLVRDWPVVLTLRPLQPSGALQLLSSLVFLAAFVERALEVFVSTWRDGGASEIADRLSAAQASLEQLKKQGATPQQLDTAAAAVQAVNQEQTRYSTATKRIALWSGLALGIAVSAVGIQVLAQLVDQTGIGTGPQAHAFSALDIVLTGGVIAGGADGIHQIANVYTSFMEATSNRAKGQS